MLGNGAVTTATRPENKSILIGNNKNIVADIEKQITTTMAKLH